jgi:hypothetical protein
MILRSTTDSIEQATLHAWMARSAPNDALVRMAAAAGIVDSRALLALGVYFHETPAEAGDGGSSADVRQPSSFQAFFTVDVRGQSAATCFVPTQSSDLRTRMHYSSAMHLTVRFHARVKSHCG